MTENPQHPGAPGAGGQQAQGQQPYGAPQQPYGAAPQQPYGAAPQQPYGAAPQQPYTTPGVDGSRYGTAAYNPGAVGQEMAEPKGWARLKTLTLASLALYVLTSIVGFILAGNEAYMDAQLDAQAGLGVPREELQEIVEASMAFTMILSIVLLAVAVGLYLLVFFGLKGGKNWARIVGTVLAALGTLFTLGGLTGVGLMMSAAPGLGAATLVISLALAAVNIWWIVTAYSRDVNAYVRARSGH